MGYHVRITTKDREFTSSDFNYIKEELVSQHDFCEQLTDSGEFNFLFQKTNEENLIFFTSELGFWVKNPDENFIKLLINIVNELNNKSNNKYFLIGDENEIYHSIDDVEILENETIDSSYKEKIKNFLSENRILIIVYAILIFAHYAIYLFYH